MNKIFLIPILALAFTACGNTPSAQAKNNDSETKSAEVKGKTINLTFADFKTKVANIDLQNPQWKYLGDKPAVIDFYADWCGPCKMIAPILDKLALEFSDKVYIYKVNTDSESELADMFGISSIPTLLFIPMEGTPEKSQGALPEEALRQGIKDLIAK